MTVRPCGPALDDCRCFAPRLRTIAEIVAAHREAVKRARRSGFAAEPRPDWLFTMLDPTAIRPEFGPPSTVIGEHFGFGRRRVA